MTDARTARRHLKAARDAFKAGDMATGERHAREALSHDPEMESARRLLARILNRQERWADAVAEWRVLTQAVPAEAEYHFQTGRLTLRLGDTLAAVPILEEAIRLRPDHIRSRTTLAKAFERLDRWEEAAAIWRPLLQSDPNNEDAHAFLLRKQAVKAASQRRLAEKNARAETKDGGREKPAQAAPPAVMKKAPDTRAMQIALARALEQTGSPNAVQAWAELLAKQPDHLEGLRALARHASQAKDWTQAAGLWDRVLAQTPDDLGAHVAKARALDHDKDPEAKAAWDELLAKQPDHLEALRALARHTTQAKDWTQAASLWDRVLTQTPDDLGAHVAKARALDHDKVPEAKAAWDELLAKQPDHLEALRALARHASQAKDWTQAASLWHRVLTQTPDDLGAHVAKARALDHAKAPEAKAAWAELLAKEPDHLEALRALARHATQAKDWTQAASLWDRVLTQTPDDLGAHVAKARALDHDKVPEAKAAWDELLAKQPDHLEALRALARHATQAKDWAQAASLWHRVLTQTPDDLGAHVAKARALDHAKAPEAKAAWAELLAKEPDHLEALRALARHATQAKDWAQAASLWHRVLTQTPDDLGAHVAKARALDHDKDPEAKAAWDELLAKQPDHLEALRALARHATQAKDWTQAAGLWHRVLAQTPDDLGAHVAKARALDHDKDPEAKAAWDELLAKQPEHLEALRALARHATQAKDWTQAASLWDRVLTQTPDDLGAHVAKARALDHAKDPEAKAAWDDLLAKQPDHLEALRALARHATQQEDWLNAAAHWLRLAQRTPTDPFPWTQWARAEERRSSSLDPWEKIVGRFPDHLEGRLLLARAARSDAAHHWRHLRRLRPAMVEPVLQLARLHLAAQDWAQAEEALLAVLELCSGHAEALASLATLHARLQRHEDCLATCRRWARAQPDDPRPLRMIARHMTAHAYSQEAREAAWEALLERVPDHAEALMTLARLRHSRRDWAGALSLWERLCRVRPQQAEAWRNHVRLLTQMDRPEDARRMLDAADTALRDIPDSLLQRAMIAQAARDLDRAETLLRRATHENPAEAAPWKALGLLRWASGDLSGALPPLRRARDISPNDPDITAALVDIARALDASGLDTARVWNAAPDKPPSLRAPDLLFHRVTAIAAERGAPRDSAIRRLPHVVLVTSSLGAGGAERQLATTAVGLRARSDCVGDVTVLVRSLDPDQRHDFFLPPLQDAGVTVETYGVSSTAEPCDTLDETPDAALLSCFPDAMGPRLVRLYRLLRRLSPTVVHAWQDTTAVEAAAVAALVGTPRILMAARSLRPDSQRRLTPYLAPAYQTLLTLPWVRLTNNSRAGLKDYADWLGVPLSCPVTPNALDVDALRRTLDPTTSAALRDRLGIAPNTPVLGGIMRFTEEKRPLLWLNTMAEVARSLPHAHFVLLGDGPMRPQVEETCRNLGLEGRAHLVGNDRMVGPWYGMMDALLLTSRVEGCPNVLLEAQAMGLPVVAPAVGGAPETVDHGRTGWIVDAAADGLAERLAERLVYCLSDEDWRAHAASAGPAFIERRHGLNSALDATLDAYTSPFLAGVSPVVLAQ